jgi:hypothetical protein
LGIDVLQNVISIPFFDQRYFIGKDFLVDIKGNQPRLSISVLLCQYILLAPKYPHQIGSLVTYKDFKNAAPFVDGFTNICEKPIADNFAGRSIYLKKCCSFIGGKPIEIEAACEIVYQFDALPRVPIFLMFNDADKEFRAQCTLLFRESAQYYLDMECLAIIGDQLASRLKKAKP